ncbi:MAG TPA: TRZ/ATZ family hydrolase [Nevskiaceae bacterium]|nr:TRZ/ATZ family hydrolase [Nevskiaceae bacterium]
MPLQTVDLLVVPEWLVPVEPSGAVLTEHALVVSEGRIVDLLPAAFAQQIYSARATLELQGRAVLPGLINTHGHAAMSLLRGLADDLPLMDWLNNHIWPAEARHVGRDFCRTGVALACAEMLRGGQTCFNDMYFFPDVTAEVVHHIGMRATIGLIVLDFPSAWAHGADEYLSRGIEVHDQVRALADPLLQTAWAPHAPYTVSDAPLAKLREYANEMDVPIHMHVHETADEIRQALDTDGRRPLQRLADLGVTGPDFIAVHMTQLTPEEIAQTAEQQLSVVHCPESNLKLASGFCPVAKLLAAGINVALGTDSAASNNDLDLWGEMRTAALLAKGIAGDATVVPAATALRMATLNGARALGLAAETGSLQKGKSADFIAVDLRPLETQPLHDVLSQLVYATHRSQITDVWVAGRALLRDRRLTTIDTTALTAAVHSWQKRLHAD